MPNILNDIIKNKKYEIAQSKSNEPISKLLNSIESIFDKRPFSISLKRSSMVAIIAEIKKASPSAGVLREDFDPISIAQSYEKNGASAISVLTDEKYFAGSKNYLKQIRQQVTLPLLRKDFIIDPYQVVESRVYGADAILMIMDILSNAQCNEIAAAAQELDLDILVEVHTYKELDRALESEFNLIGINNRDLSTFEVDITTTEKLIAVIPKHITVVSESGIKDSKEIEYLGKKGVDAVLIGETLMRQPDIETTLRQFVEIPKWSR